jgi:hypothetical protein
MACTTRRSLGIAPASQVASTNVRDLGLLVLVLS